MKQVDLAISPCPNDTFIFRHFASPGFFGDLKIRLEFADVEELNRRALQEKRHMLTKLSFHAMSALEDSYDLLSTGGAMGRGCGPLLIASDEEARRSFQASPDSIRTIYIPGIWTTAHLLCRLYLTDLGLDIGRVNFIPKRYDQITGELKSRRDCLGLIIHEERFTFSKHGLVSLTDLGAWWEDSTGMPIPLGCIAARKDMGDELKTRIEAGIRLSLRKAWDNPESVMDLVRPNAQALEDDVMRAHIELYVNSYTMDPGETGRRAVRLLFEKARRAGFASELRA